ncbi:N-acetylglucosamine 6-phosphate deacetylase [Rhizobiales bacterium GAS191]|nr:N-acetylglucosamine 6-phosphate deacetylase [Rhizobiales bacterium GAS191]
MTAQGKDARLTPRVTAGLFDLQVNGFAGVDFNDPAITAEALDEALEAMRRTGVTLCLPTIITARPGELAARLEALDRAVAASRLGPAMCPGFHLEGPFLNPAEGYRGCHPHEAMTAADPALIARLERNLSRPILLITLAPEIDGALELIAAAAAGGKVTAIGHSAATGEILARAVAAGLKLSTHLGNGVLRQLHKFDNTIMAQLAEDRLVADFIADGIHVPPHALKVMLRAKGFERTILTTDAVSAAAAPPGSHPFAGFTVERDADGSVHLPGQATLAGSSLTLDAAVRNVVNWGLASFEEAIAMASTHPRRLMAPSFAAHCLAPGSGRVTWSQAMQVETAELEAG